MRRLPFDSGNSTGAADYKHVVLGLIFLKYISDRFTQRHAEIIREKPERTQRKTAMNTRRKTCSGYPCRVAGTGYKPPPNSRTLASASTMP